ncbi:ATP-dependent helicase [Polyangium mundeleinium]|uniref:DNA 3'-5' helicase n=1 Tax=Polyangium mundeleinium TaxID=2995306 RepID=A0ABT5EXJ6_9BACT|nr:UvrD-helicase domain-containing protein [Polyangium mundeleinium]MDC0746554.1 UvrD-helicase domain-containing protein [Polyangium mundeleinium]
MTDLVAFPPPAFPEPADELNEPQARAVAHAEGPLVVFAGAGSGKTRVITYRIANLLAGHRVPPYRVLAVTFTNKAAGEMRRRIASLAGDEIAKELWIGTFHATCARLLRRFHDAAGLERNFVIYDDSDQRAVVARVLKELSLDDKRYPPRQVLSRIHKEKQEGRGPDAFEPQGFFDDAILKVYEGYERYLRKANAVDFDDLILSVLRIAEDPKSLAGDDLRARFRHVLVDEFQDVNQVQYRLVRALAASRNLCVVGDDDQSIYRWRGADVRIVRNFRRDFPDAAIVKLEQNYRSTGNVVRAALGVIKPAKDREPKELWTARDPGEPVVVVAAQNEHDEAAWVAERVREAQARGVPLGEVAIFYRVHAQSRVLEEVLRAERIPYQIVGGMRFFERAEVKDLLSYLRILDNPKSDVDLERIINVPARKIGGATLDRLTQVANALDVPLYEAILPLTDRGGLGTAAKKSLLAFRDLIESLREKAASAPPSDLAREVLERTGYARMLDEDDSAESDARKQNLQELVGSILDYEAEAAAAGQVGALSGYLERVTLSSDIDALEDAPRVSMMTVHAAKGLEFDTVFITGMEDEIFPFKGPDPKRNEDIEEERRLAYVAVTRARERLFVTHTARRMIFGNTRFGVPSRFIADFPTSSVKGLMTAAASSERSFRDGYRDGHRDEPARPRGPWSHPMERGGDAPARSFSSRSTSTPTPARAPGERYIEREPAEASGEGGLARGARVMHEKFGVGAIIDVDPGDDPIATVKFSGWGVKRIKARFLRTE